MASTALKVFGIVAPVIGGIVVAVVQLDPFDAPSAAEKAEILSNLDELVSAEGRFIRLPQKIGSSELTEWLAHKSRASDLRRKLNSWRRNFNDIDFQEWETIIFRTDNRVSYTELYRRAGVVKPVCKSLEFSPGGRALQISGDLRRCRSTLLDDVVMAVKSVGEDYSSVVIGVSNDQMHVICPLPSPDCEVQVDVGDRIASTDFQFVIVVEYVGPNVREKSDATLVTLSIAERIDIDQLDAKGPSVDRSQTEYRLPEFTLSGAFRNDRSCAPFFDTNDHTQEKPPLPGNVPEFDRAVLRACGPIRGAATREEFQALLSGTSGAADRLQSMPALSATADQLLQIWYRHNAFNHIFCGEWQDGSIGGLHLWSRYAQLQLESSACYLDSSDEELGAGGVYTIGVRSADGANQHTKKGYALYQNAAELLTLGTSAFLGYCRSNKNWRHNPTFGSYEKRCLIDSGAGEGLVRNVVICKADHPDDPDSYGLLTFYPDATPDERLMPCVTRGG